jgi:hypothetical protein
VYDFEKKSFTKHIDEAILENFTPEVFNAFLGRELTFKVNGTIYAISYEDTTYVKYTTIYQDRYAMYSTKAETKYVFLYRRDTNGWVKVSDTIQTDYNKAVSLGLNAEKTHYDDAFLHSQIRNHTTKIGLNTGYTGNEYGYVYQLKNGSVFMLIPTEFEDTRINNNSPYVYNRAVFFIPKGDGTYTISEFEPINKTTRQPELYSNMDKLDITENDNGIKVEIWIKAKLLENEKPDGIQTYQSERREVKIPYKIKLFRTLNFKTNNGKAYYSGDYLLTQTR